MSLACVRENSCNAAWKTESCVDKADVDVAFRREPWDAYCAENLEERVSAPRPAPFCMLGEDGVRRWGGAELWCRGGELWWGSFKLGGLVATGR
jgi:hypothetical protein